MNDEINPEKKEKEEQKQPQQKEFFFLNIDLYSEKLRIHVCPDMTVRQLKNKIEEIKSIDQPLQVLFLKNGTKLKNYQTLGYYHLNQLSTVYLHVKINSQPS